MSTKAKAKPKDAKGSHTTPSLVWFEIPADNPERAKKFYGSLFGWKIELFPGMTDYWHIDTGGGDDTPDGGLMARKHPEQPITNYVGVSSVDRIRGEGRETGRQNLQAQDSGAADGLLRHMPGHGGQHVRALGKERPRKVAGREKASNLTLPAPVR